MFFVFVSRIALIVYFTLNTFNFTNSTKQTLFHLFKESILHKHSLIQNEGLDIRKNISFDNDFAEEQDLILIAKYIEQKKLLDFLLNKDISLHSKIEKIEKCNELLLNDEYNSKIIKSPSPNLGLKKDFDEFLSS